MGLTRRQAQGLAAIRQRVVIRIDDNPGQLGVAIAPNGEPVVDPGEVSAQVGGVGAAVGARNHRAQDRRQFLVDRDPPRHLWKGGSGQVLARKLAQIAPRFPHDLASLPEGTTSG